MPQETTRDSTSASTRPTIARRDLRVVALVCDGIYQRHLLARLAECFNLVGVVLHASPRDRISFARRLVPSLRPRVFFEYVQARLLLPLTEARGETLRKKLFWIGGQPPPLPDVPLLKTQNVNEPSVADFVRAHAPQALIVNGTNLLRKPLLDLRPDLALGIVNLHTGLSPYTRGGNCNLFALLEGRPEEIGITVHHIDQGIDTGDIILTARPILAFDDCHEIIEAKCFHLGNESVIVAIDQLLAGKAARVAQWVSGRCYLRKTGYVYRPYQVLQANRLIKAGVLREYLNDRYERDRAIRLVGASE